MELVNGSLCLFFLLSLWRVDVCRGDGMMGTTALQKSEHCIQAARAAYELLVKEGAVDTTTTTIAHLEALAEDGKYLQKSAEGSLSKLVSQEGDLDKKLQQLQKEKQQFEMEIKASRNEKARIEKDYSAKESVLRDNEKQLQQAQKESQDAENELHHAKKKLKKKKKGVFGKIKSALGKLVGHVSSAENKVKNAKKNLERRRGELNSFQNAANAAKKALSDVENRIKQHESKIQATQQQNTRKLAQSKALSYSYENPPISGSYLLLQPKMLKSVLWP